MIISHWVPQLPKASGEVYVLVASLTARLPTGDKTPCQGMMPTCSAVASLERVKGMHTEEEREEEEVRW